MFERIKQFINGSSYEEVVISFIPKKKVSKIKKETKEEYFTALQKSLDDTENGNVISFTLEEFDKFIEKK